MSHLTAKDFPPELLEFYDYYVHGRITRHDFLDRAGQFGEADHSKIALHGRHHWREASVLHALVKRRPQPMPE